MKLGFGVPAGAIMSLLVLAGCSLNYPTPRKFAIVIGIGNYPGHPLNYTVDDANSFAAVLTANGFSIGDVRLKTDDAATKDALAADLLALAAVMSPDDLFVFYYSGHGTVYPYQGVDREWILPSQSIDGSGFFVPAKAIYDSELGEMLSVLPTRRRVVILDSCNSGGLIGDGLEADTVAPVLAGNTAWAGKVTPAAIFRAIGNYAKFSTADNGGVSPYKALVIAAAGAEESSYESSSPPYNGHGVLTHFLLQAPASGDLNHDGVVTVLETFALAKAGVDEWWNQTWAGSSYVFSPHVSGGPIDLVLF